MINVKIRLAAGICAVWLLLAGCSPVIRGPRDEIRLYDWMSEFDNGNTVSLTFSGSDASFEVRNKAYTLIISGLCSVSDDSLLIIDEDDGVSYTFDYHLYGDSVDLRFRGDSITLEKKVEK